MNRALRDPRHVVLIGMRGCGKTVTGRELASLIRRPHIDTDELIIEREGRSIAEIFSTGGVSAFRRMEREVLQHVLSGDSAVVSVGGGAVLDPANVGLMRKHARVIWLTAPAEVLWQRISNDAGTTVSRPALTDRIGLEEVVQLLTERASRYEQAAHQSVATEHLAQAEVARTIADLLGSGQARSERA